METEQKPCRHCQFQINKNARRCTHCHSFQSWIGAQGDPRLNLVALGIFALIFVPLFLTVILRDDSEQISNLTVKEAAHHIVSTPSGNQLYVLATVVPIGEPGNKWKEFYFRVNVYDAKGSLVDTFQERQELRLGKENPIRLSAVLLAKSKDVDRISVDIQKISDVRRR